ncbi:MAG: hypothetical protein V3U37_02875 [Nitrospinaceae bacterium]
MPQVDRPAPNLFVEEWVQGESSNIDRERGNVILIEVFQVNCPGCFIHGLPETIDVFNKFSGAPLKVWGLATAFEDFDKNNLENLRKLASTGEVVGETLALLANRGMLDGNRLEYRIPFPVAWDQVEDSGDDLEKSAQKIIDRDFPGFDSLPEKKREFITGQVKAYVRQKPYDAKTFDTYGLMGTPSSILIDKKGLLRHKLFGAGQGLEGLVQSLLEE